MVNDTVTDLSNMREKNERNARVQARYDDLMREGKHGHYETMNRVVREEVERAIRAVAPSEDEIVGAIERAFYDPASVDAVHLSNPHTIAARAVIALLNRKSPDTASTPVFSVEAFERGRIVGETVGWYAAKGDKSQSSPDNDTAAIVRQQGCKMLDMKDEIERLRTALQRIVAEAESDDGLTAWDGADIARAALSSGSCTEGER